MTGKLPEGKVPWDLIEKTLGASLPPEVVLGPGLGEDAALVKLGGELWAVAADPVSFAPADAGRLCVVVNANDVAVRGARPLFFVAVVLVAPGEASPDRVRSILRQIQTACRELGVSLVGGHTEVAPGLDHSLVVGTMLGRVDGRAITTGGLREGDWVGMTKWAGLEGTAILVSQYGERWKALRGPEALLNQETLAAGKWLSVVPEARAAARIPVVGSLHDVTEGGVGEALYELGRASGLELEVTREAVPVLPVTRLLCEDLGLDPLGLIGSGALLVGCAEEGRARLTEDMARLGVPFAWLGRARAGGRRSLQPVPRFQRDEILRTGFVKGIRAVLFDMDGTLIDSGYDWSAIRKQLGVGDASIIEHLNGLESPEREQGWEALRKIEREATRKARPKTGARDLLAFLRGREIRTALVTNNTEENTRFLLERFDLALDVVLTRDSGLWKPSGAPLTEALRRLGVPPSQALAVGDSRYDVLAGREAGCERICLVHAADEALARQADLRFADLAAFLHYLQLVL